MEIIGYRINVKFPALEGVRDFPASQLDAFIKALQKIDGLVLFHGTRPDALLPLCHGAARRQFAALIVSTSVVPRPHGCVSPYIHFYSTGIPNPKPCRNRPEDALFQSLVASVGALPSSMQLNEDDVERLWTAVDPRGAVMERLRALEDAIYAGPDGAGDVKRAHREALVNFYGPDRVPSYEQARTDYLELCRSHGLKKNSVDGT